MNHTIKRVLIAGPFVIVFGSWIVAVTCGHPAALMILAIVGFVAWSTWALMQILDGEW